MLRAWAHDRNKAPLQSPSDGRTRAYTGVDNLEVMSSAVKFARYLRDTIAAAAGPIDAKPRILDFGAGTGTIAERVTEAGYDVTCLEPDDRLRALLGELRLVTVPDPAASRLAVVAGSAGHPVDCSRTAAVRSCTDPCAQAASS